MTFEKLSQILRRKTIFRHAAKVVRDIKAQQGAEDCLSPSLPLSLSPSLASPNSPTALAPVPYKTKGTIRGVKFKDKLEAHGDTLSESPDPSALDVTVSPGGRGDRGHARNQARFPGICPGRHSSLGTRSLSYCIRSLCTLSCCTRSLSYCTRSRVYCVRSLVCCTKSALLPVFLP